MIDRWNGVIWRGTIVFLLMGCFPDLVRAAFPMIYGVTEGSVYREFVRIYWFTEGAVATLSSNAGEPAPYSLGQQISANGFYRFELSATRDAQQYSNMVNFSIDSTRSSALLLTNPDTASTLLSVAFEPNTYSGNPFIVVWTEDMDGNFLQNLYVGTAAATNYMRFGNNRVLRPQAIPYWAHKTCPALSSGVGTVYVADPDTPLPEELDGVSGATQKAGFELESHVRAPGEGAQLRVLLEINQSFDNGWYFAPGNPIAEETDAPSGATFGDDPYFSTSNEPSLVYAVTVSLDQPGSYSTSEPAGYGHYGGRTGTLYTDFYALDGTTERHKFDHAIQMVGHIVVTVHPLLGDVTGDCIIDLKDAITGLKICSGTTVSGLNSNGDVGTDDKLGLEEAIYALEQTAR